MKTFLVLLFTFSSIGLKSQNKRLDSTRAEIVKTKNYSIYSFDLDSFPLNSGTPFELIPYKSKNNYLIKGLNCKTIFLNNNSIRVIPNADKFGIIVLKNTTPIDTLYFNTFKLKLPEVYNPVNDKLFDSTLSIKTDSISISLIQPDLKIRQLYPRDSRYIFDTLVVNQKRKGELIDSIKWKVNVDPQTGKTNTIFSLKKFQLVIGDELEFRMLDIYRLNFVNETSFLKDEMSYRIIIK